MTKTQFKVGDKVKISKLSQYYGFSDSSNPGDTLGTVRTVKCDDEFCYRVDWANGRHNSYREGDLVPADGNYSVSYELYKAAYDMACSSWKRKLEKLFTVEQLLNGNMTVTKDFILEAHEAANSEWKETLEKEFPAAFEVEAEPYLKITNRPSSNLFDSAGKQIKGIEFINGIAGDWKGVPKQAEGAGFYISPSALKSETGVEYVPKLVDSGRGNGYALVFVRKDLA